MNVTTVSLGVVLPDTTAKSPRKKLNIVSVQAVHMEKSPICDLSKVIGTIPMSDEEFEQALASLRDSTCR